MEPDIVEQLENLRASMLAAKDLTLDNMYDHMTVNAAIDGAIAIVTALVG